MLLAAGATAPTPQLVDLYVALAGREGVRAAFGLVCDARRAGLRAQLELSGRSLKGQLKHADRIHARYVAIVGGEANIGGHVSLKNMESGDQEDTPPQNVIPTILRGSRLS